VTSLRILVTGAGGQLGGEVAAAGTLRGHDVVATTRSECDVLDPASVGRAIEAHRPAVVINCAAWTDVEGAENNSDGAFALNAMAPRILAAACASRDILIVHMSTDYVFNGSGTAPLDEWAAPSPLSVYGASKLAGEQEVRGVARRHQVIRTSWLYGRDGPNFVLAILRRADERKELRVVADQTGTPTWTGHLAPALIRVAERGIPGTYHLSNAGETTWHGFAGAIMQAAGRSGHVSPISAADYASQVARPAYSVLDNRAWRILGEAPLPDWREGLSAYVDELRSRGKLTPALP
jgi:dTDP-4-dehydrorhamnose reductase